MSIKGNYKHWLVIKTFEVKKTEDPYESIAGNSNVSELLHPSITLLFGKGSRDLLKDSLESLALRTILGELAADEQVDGVALVGALGALLPLEAENTLVEAHPPVVGLVTGQTGAVNAGLLASTETNDLAVGGVADRVALCVLEGDGGNGKVAGSGLGESAVLGGDDGGEALGGDFDIVTVLLQVDAVDGTGLGRARVVFGVDLENKVLAALLLLEDLQSGILVAGSNDTVRDFLGDDGGGGNINDVTEGNHVTERAHAVGTTGTGVGLGKSGGLDAGDVVDKVNLALGLGQGETNGSTSGRDVLEAGSSRLAKSLLELLDKRPSVKGIKEVDVAGGTAESLEGERTLRSKGRSRLLVGVSTVAQSKLLVAAAGVLLAEEARDGSVVVSSVFKGLEGVSVAALLADVAALELLEEASVVGRVAEDGDALVVLGRGTDQSDAANVDLLDSLGDADVGLGNGLLEGVEVADNVVDLVDVLVGKVLVVRLDVTGKDTGVDGGVEGLDTAAEHLGGLCDGANVPVEAVLVVLFIWN